MERVRVDHANPASGDARQLGRHIASGTLAHIFKKAGTPLPALARSAAPAAGDRATTSLPGPSDPLADEPSATALPPVGGTLKRTFDIVVASTALILLSPVMLSAAGLIRLTIGGPVLFSHTRIGANGREFACLKFRTMAPDAEEKLQQILESDPARAEEWKTTRKLRNDPRITWLGHHLRRTSIDELPQLFNVLRGEMSCVGPRPVVADELAPYGENAVDYLSARPGMTGAWQVSGRNNLSYQHRVDLDVNYVRDWSLWKDIRILLLTVPAIFRFNETA